MTRTFDTPMERNASLWSPVAAAILGIEGMRTLLYAAFLGAPIVNAGADVPAVGTLPYGWVVAGIIALFAAAGVLARRSWGRYLGSVSAVLDDHGRTRQRTTGWGGRHRDRPAVRRALRPLAEVADGTVRLTV